MIPINHTLALLIACRGLDLFFGRLMLWCERRKPFQDSMLTSKTAIFKLRKELRSAIKTLTVAEEALVEVDGVVAGCVSVWMCLHVQPPCACASLPGVSRSVVIACFRQGQCGTRPHLTAHMHIWGSASLL